MPLLGAARRLLCAFPPGSHTRVTCAAHADGGLQKLTSAQTSPGMAKVDRNSKDTKMQSIGLSRSPPVLLSSARLPAGNGRRTTTPRGWGSPVGSFRRRSSRGTTFLWWLRATSRVCIAKLGGAMRSPPFCLSARALIGQGEPYSPFVRGCVRQLTFAGSAYNYSTSTEG